MDKLLFIFGDDGVFMGLDDQLLFLKTADVDRGTGHFISVHLLSLGMLGVSRLNIVVHSLIILNFK